MSHVLEHIEDSIGAIEELWRISRSGARVNIRVPHYTGPYAWKDPTHRRCFAASSFSYFLPNGTYSYYCRARFTVQRLRLNYYMVPPERRLLRWWGALVQRLLDAHPTFAERYVAYLVGGIDEIEVTLETIK